MLFVHSLFQLDCTICTFLLRTQVGMNRACLKFQVPTVSSTKWTLLCTQFMQEGLQAVNHDGLKQCLLTSVFWSISGSVPALSAIVCRH